MFGLFNIQPTNYVILSNWIKSILIYFIETLTKKENNNWSQRASIAPRMKKKYNV